MPTLGQGPGRQREAGAAAVGGAGEVERRVGGVARRAVRLGLMDPAALVGLREVRPLRNNALPAGRSVTGGELAALLAGCMRKGTPIGARDAALLAVAYAGGLRRAELVALAVADWDRARGELRVRHGKGGRQRAVYPAAGAVAALDDWLAIRDAWPGPLFVAVTKGRKIGRKALIPQTVYDVLQRRAAAAGVDHLSPHDLRRTFAGDLQAEIPLDPAGHLVSDNTAIAQGDERLALGFDNFATQPLAADLGVSTEALPRSWASGARPLPLARANSAASVRNAGG